jgi:hypothetical protein
MSVHGYVHKNQHKSSKKALSSKSAEGCQQIRRKSQKKIVQEISHSSARDGTEVDTVYKNRCWQL